MVGSKDGTSIVGDASTSSSNDSLGMKCVGVASPRSNSDNVVMGVIYSSMAFKYKSMLVDLSRPIKDESN